MVAVGDALQQLIAPERGCQPGPLKFPDESSGNFAALMADTGRVIEPVSGFALVTDVFQRLGDGVSLSTPSARPATTLDGSVDKRGQFEPR